MSETASPQRYHPVMIILHWLMALVILFAAVTALILDDMPDKAMKAQMTNLHFVLGISVIGLLVLRSLTRLATQSPPLPADTHPHVVKAARFGHLGLYALMLGVPFIGVLTAFFRGKGVDFGFFEIVSPFEANRSTGRFFKEIHEFLAYLFFAGIGGHVLFALWHQLIAKDGLIDRMRFSLSGKKDATELPSASNH
jgi:cytochrome b561